MDESTGRILIRFGLIAYGLMVVLLVVAVGLGVELWSQHQESDCEYDHPALTTQCRELYSMANHILGGVAIFQPR